MHLCTKIDALQCSNALKIMITESTRFYCFENFHCHGINVAIEIAGHYTAQGKLASVLEQNLCFFPIHGT